MNRRPTRRLILATLCLATGSLLYILFRPKNLLMFRWVETLGGDETIDILRTWIHSFNFQLPRWTIYSLPFALWVLAYMVAIDGIWGRSNSVARRLWLWSVPAAAVASEIGQSLNVIPGQFDRVDLSIVIVATIAGYGLSNLTGQNEEITAS